MNFTDFQQQQCNSVNAFNGVIPYSAIYATFMVYFSTLSSVGGFIQVAHLFNEKTVQGRISEAKGVSTVAWLMSVVSNICWVIYGLMIEDMAVTASCVVGLIGSTLVLVFVAYYMNYDAVKALHADQFKLLQSFGSDPKK
jgi:uncharacterized protein with PQ loop repeat